jgi:RNA polymerase sigma factor FliA
MKADRSNQLDMGSTVSDSRDEMLRLHMGLVHNTVERLCGPSVRSSGTFDDLVSAGMMGLVNAFDGFDPKRGVAFSTYAHPRVRGAILDELRRLDTAPRSVRRKKRAITKARDAVKSRGNRHATDQAVAAEMGIEIETLHSWELEAECGTIESLDSTPVAESASASVDSENWQTRAEGADALIERQEEVDGVREALAKMPEQERLVLILYFYEDLKLRQIGEVIGVSESRVSQIRSTALARLRKELAATVAA